MWNNSICNGYLGNSSERGWRFKEKRISGDREEAAAAKTQPLMMDCTTLFSWRVGLGSKHYFCFSLSVSDKYVIVKTRSNNRKSALWFWYLVKHSLFMKLDSTQTQSIPRQLRLWPGWIQKLTLHRNHQTRLSLVDDRGTAFTCWRRSGQRAFLLFNGKCFCHVLVTSKKWHFMRKWFRQWVM